MSPEGKTLLNVIVLGLGFMVTFTAFGTCGNIEVGFELFQTLKCMIWWMLSYQRVCKPTFHFFSANRNKEFQQYRVSWKWLHKVLVFFISLFCHQSHILYRGGHTLSSVASVPEVTFSFAFFQWVLKNVIKKPVSSVWSTTLEMLIWKGYKSVYLMSVMHS